jgi:soluble lytic murein transglycosylase-like protein
MTRFRDCVRAGVLALALSSPVAPAWAKDPPRPPLDLRPSIAASIAPVPRIRPVRVKHEPSVDRATLDAMIAKHAKANDVPEALVHRVVVRESRYQPGIVGPGGCYGLMQIKHGTARAMGYTGSASGLLDAETNLTYAVKYLAGAYRKANGDERRAIGYYARGY